MFETLERRWHRFRDYPPGKRFRGHYERKEKRHSTPLRKVMVIGSGLAVMAVGVFLLAVPGPGILFLLIGAGLIAEESLLAARLLDWLELRLRRLTDRALARWRAASPLLKIVVVLTSMGLVVIVAFAAYAVLVSGQRVI